MPPWLWIPIHVLPMPCFERPRRRGGKAPFVPLADAGACVFYGWPSSLVQMHDRKRRKRLPCAPGLVMCHEHEDCRRSLAMALACATAHVAH